MRTAPIAVAALAAFFSHARADKAPAAEESATAVDDYAIERNFTKAMGALAGRNTPIHGLKAIRKAQEAAAGRRVAAPPAPAAPTSVLAAEDGVLIVGAIYKCKDCDDWHTGGMASGWALSTDGLVVTNHHVVNLDQEDENVYLGVMDRQGHVMPVKEVVANDKVSDIAIVRVDAKESPLHPLRIAPKAPASGTPVSVISHPDGRYFCLSKGHVTRHHHQPAEETDIGKALDGQDVPMATWMSISADFGVGSSGAPVLDDQGRVVGMVCLTYTVVATENEKEDADPPAYGVQMVFKDCVPVPALRSVIREKK